MRGQHSTRTYCHSAARKTALQDMLYGLICMSAPPGELWMKNQDADQKKRSSYVWLFQVGDLLLSAQGRT